MKCKYKYKCIAIDSGQLLFIVSFDEYFGSRCCDCKKPGIVQSILLTVFDNLLTTTRSKLNNIEN